MSKVSKAVHYSQIVKYFDKIISVKHKNFNVEVQGIKSGKETTETFTYKQGAVAKAVSSLLSQFKGI